MYWVVQCTSSPTSRFPSALGLRPRDIYRASGNLFLHGYHNSRRSGRRMASAWRHNPAERWIIWLLYLFVCLLVSLFVAFVGYPTWSKSRMPLPSTIMLVTQHQVCISLCEGRMPSAWCHNPAERWIIPACNIHQHQANALHWAIL